MEIEYTKGSRDKLEAFKLSEAEKKEIIAYCKKMGYKQRSKFYRNAIARAMLRGE